MTDRTLSALAPYPAPLELPDGYDRHDPKPADLRTRLDELADAQDWANLTWPRLIDGLLALGRTDVPLSRLAEGHIDALRILRQTDRGPVADALYGVWASRSQQTGVQGRREGSKVIMNGTIRFASGAGVLDRALVPVWLSADQHVLVDLAVDRLPVDASEWATSAMEVSRSHSVAVQDVEIDVDALVGPTDFYLKRPAFFPGGVGVAACWAGGAARVADLTRRRLRDPQGPVAARLGRLRTALAGAGALLDAAGRRLDELLALPEPDVAMLRTLSTEVRAGVATAVHEVLDEATRVAGPAGLAFDLDLTRAIADLRLYVLQQNADSDAAYLGGLA